MTYSAPDSLTFLKNTRGTDSSILALEFQNVGNALNTHASRHKSLGADPIRLDELASPTNITTLNTNTGTHGLCPKLSGTSTQFLNGIGGWSVPIGGVSLYTTIGPVGSGADYECDGTDDNTQIQAALDAATSSAEIIFMAGNYTISSMLSVTGKDLTLTGIGKVTLNVSLSTTEDPAFVFYGTDILTTTLSANSNKDTTTVTLTSVSGLAVGDLIVITNNVDWTAEYPGFKTGEMYTIKDIDVSGKVVTLNDPLLRNYTTAASSIAEVFRPIRICIDNIRLIGQGATLDKLGIKIVYGKCCSIRNCEFSKNGLSSIHLYSCYDANISGNNISHSEMAGYGYGVALANACTKIRVEHNNIHACRHPLTSGMAGSFNGLNRDIIFSGNTCSNSVAGTGAVDSHEVTINWIVNGNIITSTNEACINGAQSLIFANNYCNAKWGVSNRGTKNVPLTVAVTGNTINDGGIFADSGDDEYTSLSIIANTSYNGDTPVVLSNASKVVRALQVKNNTINSPVNYGMYFILSSTTAPANIDISDNQITDIDKSGIRLVLNYSQPHLVKISNNSIMSPNTLGSQYAGIWLESVRYAGVFNNMIYDANATNALGIEEDANCDYNVYLGNICKGMTGTKFSLVGTHNTNVNNISL